jgi:hypothetical protein
MPGDADRDDRAVIAPDRTALFRLDYAPRRSEERERRMTRPHEVTANLRHLVPATP